MTHRILGSSDWLELCGWENLVLSFSQSGRPLSSPVLSGRRQSNPMPSKQPITIACCPSNETALPRSRANPRTTWLRACSSETKLRLESEIASTRAKYSPKVEPEKRRSGSVTKMRIRGRQAARRRSIETATGMMRLPVLASALQRKKAMELKQLMHLSQFILKRSEKRSQVLMSAKLKILYISAATALVAACFPFFSEKAVGAVRVVMWCEMCMLPLNMRCVCGQSTYDTICFFCQTVLDVDNSKSSLVQTFCRVCNFLLPEICTSLYL